MRYLNDSERLSYRLTVREGRLYDASGRLFDTRRSISLHRVEPKAIFVMDEYGNIFASLEHEKGLFYHSGFLAGMPVAGAGELMVENGYIRSISNASGHYRPGAALNQQVIERLESLGVAVERIQIEGF